MACRRAWLPAAAATRTPAPRRSAAAAVGRDPRHRGRRVRYRVEPDLVAQLGNHPEHGAAARRPPRRRPRRRRARRSPAFRSRSRSTTTPPSPPSAAPRPTATGQVDGASVSIGADPRQPHHHRRRPRAAVDSRSRHLRGHRRRALRRPARPSSRPGSAGNQVEFRLTNANGIAHGRPADHGRRPAPRRTDHRTHRHQRRLHLHLHRARRPLGLDTSRPARVECRRRSDRARPDAARTASRRRTAHQVGVGVGESERRLDQLPRSTNNRTEIRALFVGAEQCPVSRASASAST